MESFKSIVEITVACLTIVSIVLGVLWRFIKSYFNITIETHFNSFKAWTEDFFMENISLNNKMQDEKINSIDLELQEKKAKDEKDNLLCDLRMVYQEVLIFGIDEDKLREFEGVYRKYKTLNGNGSGDYMAKRVYKMAIDKGFYPKYYLK